MAPGPLTQEAPVPQFRWRRRTGAVALIAAACALAAAPSLTNATSSSASAAGKASIASVGSPLQLHGPLRTSGRWIVTGQGQRVPLAAVNWSGAETQAYTVGGLDERKLSDLAALVRTGGFNAVRLPWSNQLVEDDPVVPARYLSANPQLVGQRALTVLDEVVRALRHEGVMVILDNHRSNADWCCDEEHGSGLWYTAAYPESAWLADWTTMARRYAGFQNVVAAELRNEIRPDPSLAPGPTEATWGDGARLTDWRAAAERGGEAVLGANPKLLVVVGGTEYQGNLTGVRTAPVRLSRPGRVIYAAHDYRWFHPDAELTDYAAFARSVDARWGYVTTPGQSWTAPVLVSETGTCTNPNVTEKCAALDPAYTADITRYLRTNSLDVAYWPFNGAQGTGYDRTYGAPETYGLLAPDWSGYGSAWIDAEFASFAHPVQGPGIDRPRARRG